MNTDECVAEEHCECQNCVDARRWEADLKPQTPEAMTAFTEMLIRIENAETDAQWAEAVLLGKWPNSVAILEEALRVAKLQAAN